MSPGLSKINSISGPDHYSEQINLTDILQQALQGFRQTDRHSPVIVRCEALPMIEADRKAIARVFNDLVHMIVHHPPNGNRLFLYVDCEEENVTANTGLSAINKRYTINFHTNICTDEAWKTVHQNAITACRTVLAQYGAGFTVNDIRSTGCLFSISLLGKM